MELLGRTIGERVSQLNYHQHQHHLHQFREQIYKSNAISVAQTIGILAKWKRHGIEQKVKVVTHRCHLCRLVARKKIRTRISG